MVGARATAAAGDLIGDDSVFCTPNSPWFAASLRGGQRLCSRPRCVTVTTSGSGKRRYRGSDSFPPRRCDSPSSVVGQGSCSLGPGHVGSPCWRRMPTSARRHREPTASTSAPDVPSAHSRRVEECAAQPPPPLLRKGGAMVGLTIDANVRSRLALSTRRPLERQQSEGQERGSRLCNTMQHGAARLGLSPARSVARHWAAAASAVAAARRRFTPSIHAVDSRRRPRGQKKP